MLYYGQGNRTTEQSIRVAELFQQGVEFAGIFLYYSLLPALEAENGSKFTHFRCNFMKIK